MQVPQTESPSEFTTSAVLTAYKALPESLRPFYAHIHCGSAAIVAALGLTAEDNNVLETAVKAIGDLADDAEAFDRDAAAESGTLADMIRELARTLGDDSNPLVVSLDVIWGAISSSSIVTGADPDDDEDPIEHYLYDNSDLTGLMGAYWDLQGVLEIMFGELGMNADFRGSLIELPTEAASVAELNKSLQRLSSSSRACFAWCHNRIVSVLRDLSNDDPKVLEKNLESSGIQPLFIPAVLRQFNESRTESKRRARRSLQPLLALRPRARCRFRAVLEPSARREPEGRPSRQSRSCPSRLRPGRHARLSSRRHRLPRELPSRGV